MLAAFLQYFSRLLAGIFAGVLFVGLEQGLFLGAALGLAIYLSRSLTPHMAVMGRVPNTEHYRNVLRHAVVTFPALLLLRFDESLTFLNASSIKDLVQKQLQAAANVNSIVLSGAAINYIDSSGAHTLLEIAQDLKDAGIEYHLAEIKGPVLDYFAASGFNHAFVGQVFLSLQEAVDRLTVPA